jgi:hypothetical protein
LRRHGFPALVGVSAAVNVILSGWPCCGHEVPKGRMMPRSSSFRATRKMCLIESASSCHGSTDRRPDAAPDGEAQHEHGWKSPSSGCRPSAIAFVGRPQKGLPPSCFAGEGDFLGSILQHFFVESRTIDRRGEGLMVHSRAGFAHIGEADAELQQGWKRVRLISAPGGADLVDRAQEAIAGMRVVVAEVSRPLSGRGAGEDEAKVVLELVGEAVHG